MSSVLLQGAWIDFAMFVQEDKAFLTNVTYYFESVSNPFAMMEKSSLDAIYAHEGYVLYHLASWR